MTIRAPADKRFRRAHVTPVRRRRSRGRRSVRLLRAALVFAAAAYVGYRIVSMVLGAPALRIDRIVVRGNERLSVGEVQALMGSIRGESILLADLDAGRQKLIMSPWVSDVALRRVLPSTIEVVVSERNPLGLGRLAGQLYLVDGRGTIIDEYGAAVCRFRPTDYRRSFDGAAGSAARGRWSPSRLGRTPHQGSERRGGSG